MREIAFSIPVSGVIRLDGNSITVVVNRTSTNVSLEERTEPKGHAIFEPGESMFDVLLQAAQEFLRRKSYNRFSGPQLFEIAREKYPGLNKRSFMTRLTASTPNHPSYKHHLAHRAYFSRIAPGIYSLEHKYSPKKAVQKIESSDFESTQEKVS